MITLKLQQCIPHTPVFEPCEQEKNNQNIKKYLQKVQSKKDSAINYISIKICSQLCRKMEATVVQLFKQQIKIQMHSDIDILSE